MGIDRASFQHLAALAARGDGRPGARGPAPGLRGFPCQPRDRRRYRMALADAGRRMRLNRPFPAGRVYLHCEVRKTPGARPGGATLQSDHQARRRRADGEGPAAPELQEA